MPDGTTTQRPMTTWNEWTRTEALALRGDLPCGDCDGIGSLDGATCPECRGAKVVTPRATPQEAGASNMLDALTSLAESVAFADVHGLPLPERSRIFLDELRAGLGARLVHLLECVENLETDVKRARRRGAPCASTAALRGGV